MNWNLMFFLNSILLGVGLAMDAFSVSIANALTEPHMKKGRACLIAGVYAVFQFAMPMAGWICVHTIANLFTSFQKFIPWIALILLLYIGGKMILEVIIQKINSKKQSSLPSCEETENTTENLKKISFATLLVQGIATSIDALSVGFTISEYNWLQALVSSVIIAFVTFWICIGGLVIGRTVGQKLESKANILGGIILIGIGLEIFIKGVFF